MRRVLLQDDPSFLPLPGCAVVVDLPTHRGCPILPCPPAPDADVADMEAQALYWRGGTTLLVVAAGDECLFVVSMSGRCGWVLSAALRHVGAPPGDADAASVYLFPFLLPPRATV